MKQINVRLEESLIRRLKLYSVKNEVSMQEVVKQALEKLLKGGESQ